MKVEWDREKQGRVNDGPMKFGADWTGYFLRGDSACGKANMLRAVARFVEEEEPRRHASTFAKCLRKFADELDQCRENS